MICDVVLVTDAVDSDVAVEDISSERDVDASRLGSCEVEGNEQCPSLSHIDNGIRAGWRAVRMRCGSLGGWPCLSWAAKEMAAKATTARLEPSLIGTVL